jgi:hypothetical protein
VIVRGATSEDILAACEVAFDQIGNGIVCYDLRQQNKRRDDWTFTLRVQLLDLPGVRVHWHKYLLGYGKPRRSKHACGHAYGAFMVSLYERCSHARIRTAKAYYRDSLDFLDNYQAELDSNVGSVFAPVRYADSCTCAGDDLYSDSREPWQWRKFGEVAAIPNAENIPQRKGGLIGVD